MATLVRGGNTALPTPHVATTVNSAVPVDVSALLVNADQRVRSDDDLVFYNAPEHESVRWSDTGAGQRIETDLSALPADVHAVLVVVSLAEAASFGAVPPPQITVHAVQGSAMVGFTATGLTDERAIVGVELYRRGDGWKVRAVGQGFAGGLAELVTSYGIEVDDPGDVAAAPATSPTAQPIGPPSADQPTQPSAPPPPADTSVPAGGRASMPHESGPPGDVEYVERAWLVWEDASRSLAAYRSATDHALAVRDDEVAGKAPRGRHQHIVAAATDRLSGDAAQLRSELSACEPMLTPEVAPWDAPTWLTWQPRQDLAEGVLLGHLGAAELPDLRVPLVLRMPWRRGVWISRGLTDGASAAYAWSLVTRYLAAVPAGVVGIDVVDVSGLSGAGWLQNMPPSAVRAVLGGGVSAGMTASSERLGRLLDLVDLRQVGTDDLSSGGIAPELVSGPPVRLVVVLDVGSALAEGDETMANRLLRLAEDGPGVGVPLLLVETDTTVPESVLALRVRQCCHGLPSSEGTIGDPWVNESWTFTPDVLPDVGDGTRAPSLFGHVLTEHATIAAGDSTG
jgi:stress response protein SCP2